MLGRDKPADELLVTNQKLGQSDLVYWVSRLSWKWSLSLLLQMYLLSQSAPA